MTKAGREAPGRFLLLPVIVVQVMYDRRSAYTTPLGLTLVGHHPEVTELFVWTRTTDQILETLAAYCNRINDSGH